MGFRGKEFSCAQQELKMNYLGSITTTDEGKQLINLREDGKSSKMGKHFWLSLKSLQTPPGTKPELCL